MRSETSDEWPLPGIDGSANMMPLLLLATLHGWPIRAESQGRRQACGEQLLDGDAHWNLTKACSCASRTRWGQQLGSRRQRGAGDHN